MKNAKISMYFSNKTGIITVIIVLLVFGNLFLSGSIIFNRIVEKKVGKLTQERIDEYKLEGVREIQKIIIENAKQGKTVTIEGFTDGKIVFTPQIVPLENEK